MPDTGSDEEDFSMVMTEYVDQKIRADHPILFYQMEMKLAEADLGLAISKGIRLNETRQILDMLDTLYGLLSDPDSKLPDQQRKMLNHADNVWLDLKSKLSSGDERASFLLSSHSHMSEALGYLIKARDDPLFKEIIPDYLLKYLSKLSIFTYREAIGHVML
ncbi:MAG: DUF1940 domain-containing protein [Candidatus Thermoplasmatota archaeon]|jgi:hypothetical protein|nr:DUF1940 domain-containing protein [Candidatus Thermoplasmatota archaeon]